MSQIISMMMLMTNSMMFSSTKHPMNMGLMLLMQTMFMCMLMSSMSYSSWFSYILFIVFVGGMLVLFVYMTSIASNEMFKKNTIYLLLMMLMLLLTLTLWLDPFIISTPIQLIPSMNNSPTMTMSPLYNNPSSNITMFMVLYLFLTLIVIVSLTMDNKGPLRPTN